MIPRDRLFERLNTGLGGKLTLVCAPAGFGKTTLLVEWLSSSIASQPGSHWMNATTNSRFSCTRLQASLQTVFPDACQNTASLLNARQFPLPDQVATLIINDLADLPEDMILVLDDYHLIHSREIHHLLDHAD